MPKATHRCEQCALPLSEDAPRCGACLAQPPAFTHTEAAALYADPVSHWVTALKFGHDLTYARLLAEAMRPGLRALLARQPEAQVLAVPLHRQRLRQRGFNQAHEIARQLARLEGTPLAPNRLHRHKHTARQTTLSKAQRAHNVRGAFSCQGGDWPASIILVDDVMTTGNTMRQCAQTLIKAGVENVQALVFARA